jgi:SAM-dependent methyltransferase
MARNSDEGATRIIALVPWRTARHKPAMPPQAIFDRAARRRRRDRAAADFAAHDFLRAAMLDGIADRLATVTRAFRDILDLGCFDGGFVPPAGARIARLDAGFRFARGAGGVQADEDRLPFADASFDAVVSAGVLDQVDDLPGALALARRVLRPDGLFLAALVGAGSFPRLRQALRVGDGDRPAARLHPQVDVRSAGDLLVRAGFALPVADVETLEIGYPDLGRLLDDLRGAALTNVLIDRVPLTRRSIGTAMESFAAAAGPDGRVRERVELLFLTGWAPDPSQPKPARRGSGGTSLADALKPRREPS